MTKKNPVYLTVLLVALSITITFMTTFVLTKAYSEDKQTQGIPSSMIEDVLPQKTLEKIREIALYYAALYPDKVNTEDIEKYLIASIIAGAGDTFGNYVSAQELDSYLDSVEGNYEGIGVSVLYSAQTGLIEILQVFKDSPAEEAGILEGDLIVYVGKGEQKQSVAEIGYYKTIELIRGDKGTYADFSVLRDGEILDFSVQRREVENQTVSFHMYSKDSRVAVIKISKFESATVGQFKAAMNEAKAAGAEAYVFDVRSNPGGEINAITSVLDMLLPEGPIIRLEYKDEKYNKQINSDAACIDAPMAVLINGSTASAGELFCAALSDYNKAVLVGTNTYGKGTMQSLRQLSDGSAISITIAYYLPPFSKNYHGKGVAPDIKCDISEELKTININKYTDENDNQLARAVEALGLSSLQ